MINVPGYFPIIIVTWQLANNCSVLYRKNFVIGANKNQLLVDYNNIIGEQSDPPSHMILLFSDYLAMD